MIPSYMKEERYHRLSWISLISKLVEHLTGIAEYFWFSSSVKEFLRKMWTLLKIKYVKNSKLQVTSEEQVM